MSLVPAEVLMRALLTPNAYAWMREFHANPCIVPDLLRDAYAIHGRRRGARRVRRYLRRYRAREAARWRAEWIAHPFNGRFDPKGHYWRAYRDAKLNPALPLPMALTHYPDEAPLGFYRADLLLTRPSYSVLLTGVAL